MNRTSFIVVALLLMAAVAFYVRAGIEPTDPPQQTGPATPHAIDGAYADCLNCHGNITESHDAMFGEGEYDDCLSCHQPE